MTTDLERLPEVYALPAYWREQMRRLGLYPELPCTFADDLEAALSQSSGADSQKSGEGLRELVQRWRDYGKDCGVSQVWGKCADELESLLTEGQPQ